MIDMSRSPKTNVECFGSMFLLFQAEGFFQVPALGCGWGRESLCHEATFPASPHAMNLSSNAWELAILPVFLGFGPGNRRVLLQGLRIA